MIGKLGCEITKLFCIANREAVAGMTPILMKDLASHVGKGGERSLGLEFI